MSEGITVALIGFAGAVLGAAIAGFAAIAAAGAKKEGQTPLSCGLLGLFASLGAAGGLVLGALFGLTLMQRTTPQQPSNPIFQVPPTAIIQPSSASPTIQPSQPTVIFQPPQATVNCSFIDELVQKADIIQRLYEGQSLAGVQARLLYPVDVPVGWTVHKDGKEYYGPIHFDAGIVASFWSPVSCRPLSINQ